MELRIMYKQRHTEDKGVNKGRKFTPARNADFVKYMGEKVHVLPTHSHEENIVKYMGEREHVEHKLNAPNGLFGLINGKFSDDYDTEEMQRYVYKMTTPHRNIFHDVFSFTPTSVEEAGLRTLADWENWVKYNISEIADVMNVKIENLEYLAAVHNKKGQPHIHIMWWDKSQQVYVNKIDSVKADQIRVNVTQNTYRHLFSDIYNKEEKMRRTLRNDIGEFTRNNVINGKLNDDYAMQIMARILRITEVLPPKGQLKYRFMGLSTQAKKEIDELTNFIIENNPDFNKQYQEICEQRLLYNEMLHNDQSKYGAFQTDLYLKKLRDETENAVGNEILRIIKAEKKAGRLNIGKRENDTMALPDGCDMMTPPDEYDTITFLDDDDFVFPDSEPVTQPKQKLNWSKDFKAARELARNGEYEKALELYQKEATAGNILATYEIGDLYRRNLLKGETADSYFKTALDGFLAVEPTAKKIKPYIQYRIGRMYYDGYGTDKDIEKALDWLKKAADNGNIYASISAAKILADKEYDKHDMAAARDTLAQTLDRFTKENVKDSELVSQLNFNLGKLYTDEEEYKPELAEKHFKQAVELNNAYAMYALANLYLSDERFDKLDQALLLLNNAKSANKDISPSADFKLGVTYLYNDRIKNIALGKRYLIDSANAGNEYSRIVLNSFTAKSIFRLVESTGKLLENTSSSSYAAMSECAKSLFGRGDLSKEQIRELLLKLADKENTAEM